MRAARDFVASALVDQAFVGDADAVLLLVSELATNAVRHAGTPFEITVDARGTDVRVEVIDQDVAHPPQARQPGADDTSGRGLFIVEKLATTWGSAAVGGGGKSVWFTLT